MYYQECKAFATEYRKELQPVMKKMGFNISVTTFKEYCDEGKLIVKIKKVPKNFPVWSSEYSRYDFTSQAEKLKSSIALRIDKLIAEKDIDCEYEVLFNRDIPYLKYEETSNDN